MEPPLARKDARVDDDRVDDDPGFFILFQPAAVIHGILGNVALQQVNPNNANAPNIPPQGANAGQSFQAVADFIDAIALAVGMTPANFTKNDQNRRDPGLFHGIPQHQADAFEQMLSSYVWGLGPGQSMGKLYRVSPSGADRTTFTHKREGPSQ